MAEVAAAEAGEELSAERLAQDEDLIRKLQELQRQSDDEVAAETGEAEEPAQGGSAEAGESGEAGAPETNAAPES
jgi:hypothetical protein